MKPYEQFLSQSIQTSRPFEPLLIEFCDVLSQSLFAHPAVKQYPDIVALAFWLRRGHILELEHAFEALLQPGQLRVPRGLVFHIAPANVEVMFVYSWILSLLVGNSNIVRLPSKESPGLTLLFHALHFTMDKPQFAPIRAATCLLSYGHEVEINMVLSARAHMRVIWGGDDTINTLRKIPLNPLGRELTFADRYAFAAIDASAYLAAATEERQKLVHAFYNDVFWYDQMACASPRTLFWVGDSAKAAADFYSRLHKHLTDQRYTLPLALALKKETYLYKQALVLSIKQVHRLSNELTIVDLAQFDAVCREHCGAGLLYALELGSLNELADIVTDRDQTLTYYGFTAENVNNLVTALNGRGLDRLVPVGQALSFDYLWDGYNLLNEFTKVVKTEKSEVRIQNSEEIQ